jgi:hypothetical protein
MIIFGVYTKNKICWSCSKCIQVWTNIASILLTAVVAVSKLSHMLCFRADCLLWMSLDSNAPWQVKHISASDWAMWHGLFLCHYAVHVAVFCDSLEKCVAKNAVCWDVRLWNLVESYQHLWGKFCCTITIVILVWEQLASSKSSLLSTRLHSAISHKTEFLMDKASRFLNIHIYIYIFFLFICC